MQRDREKRSWGERNRTSSYHADVVAKPAQNGRQTTAVKEYKAALEALFEKKPDASDRLEKLGMPAARVARVVEASPVSTEPNKRQDMLRKISLAQGSKAISDAVEAFYSAGFTLPDDQEVFLQLLEHRDELRVREAIEQLERLLAGQLPKRKPVLVQRLKRLEENADESATREAAAMLRRKVA